ncbi:hypothetical protein SH449x_004595 [Pirellulaceae bacterium SH449]
MNRLTENRLTVIGFALALLMLAADKNIAYSADPTGRWVGEWRSQSTGHRGPMRATVRQSGDGSYQARFSGRFALVIPFTYKVAMHPSYDEYGNVHLYASKPLGPLMGSYTMNAVSMGNQLSGSFQAAKDVGSIQMRRVR